MSDALDRERTGAGLSAASLDYRWLLGVTAALTAGFFLRVLFYNGPAGSDDLRYVQFSEELLRQHGFSTLDHAAGRLALLVLIGFPAVIGGNYFFGALANIVYASLADVLVTLFVFRKFGARASFVAAAFLSFAGTTMVYTGAFSPEPLLGLFMILAAICVYEALPETRTRFGLLVCAGLLTGIAYSIKDTGILLLPPVFLYVAWYPRHLTLRQRAVAFAAYFAGFVAYWFLDSLAYLILSGDFFYKIRSIQEVHNVGMTEASSVIDFIRRSWWNAYEIPKSWDYLLLPIVLAVPAWLLLLVRARRLALFALVGAFVLAFLIAGSSSLSRLVNLPFQERYVQPILPFAAIALGYATTALGGDRLRTRLAVGIAALLLAVGCAGAVGRAGNLYFTEAVRTAATSIEALPDASAPVYVDVRMQRALRQMLPAEQFGRVRLFDASQPPALGYFLFYRSKDGQIGDDLKAVRARPDVAIVSTLALDQSVAYRYAPMVARPRYIVEIGRYGG